MYPVRTTPLVELFAKIETDTWRAQRAKTSHLNSLLKGVRNSTAYISRRELIQIKRCWNNILTRLENQNSKIYEKKENKLYQVLMEISLRRHKVKFLNKIDYVQNILVGDLELKLEEIKGTIYQCVNSLPSEEHREEAINIMRAGNYAAFNSSSEITNIMFPQNDALPTYEEAVAYNGYHSQRLNNEYLSKWTVLEAHGNELDSLARDFRVVREVLTANDLLSLIKLSESGEPIYSYGQDLLIKMHDKYRY